MYLICHLGVNRGLKEYTSFVESKEAAGFPEMREVTQKPRINNLSFPSLEAKQSFKSATNKNIPGLQEVPVVPPRLLEKENIEEQNLMVD